MSKTAKQAEDAPPKAKITTDSWKASGGMCSRVGKETIIRDLCFVRQLGGKEGESTSQQQEREALGKKRDAEGEDDEDFQGFDLDDFYSNTAAQPGKDAAKGQKPTKPGAQADKKDGKGDAAGRDEEGKQKKKDQKTKSQDMASAMMIGQ
jgi:hypothetical protein